MNTGTANRQGKALALFISDLHLSEANPKTTQAFLGFLASQAKNAERLYILGDLFEYWAGDDGIDSSYNRAVINAIRALSDAGTAVYWQPGNRDFLTGERFAAESGATVLPDLHDTTIGNRKIAMAHGDAQCLGDTDYLKFRAMVRNPQWQQQFLALPLPQRIATIESFRKESHQENTSKSDDIWDVTPSAIDAVFTQTGADVFIHGHTHRPGIHENAGKTRYVLADWGLDTGDRRGGWLELSAPGDFAVHHV